jgi:DNA-directed RNA polymerase specialized sigma24 family protein
MIPNRVSEESISLMLSSLRDNNDEAINELWRTWFHRLKRFARRRMKAVPGQSYDEEDAAQSALVSFCAGLDKGKYEGLSDFDSVSRLLITITARKVATRRIHELTQKRGGGRVLLESALSVGDDAETASEFTGAAAEGPGPDVISEFADECESLVARLSKGDSSGPS